MADDDMEALNKRMDECMADWKIISDDLSERSKELFIAQEVNTRALEETARQQSSTDKRLDKLIANTEGLVATWTTVTNIQKFIKWAASFAAVAYLITWVHSFLDKIHPFDK